MISYLISRFLISEANGSNGRKAPYFPERGKSEKGERNNSSLEIMAPHHPYHIFLPDFTPTDCLTFTKRRRRKKEHWANPCCCCSPSSKQQTPTNNQGLEAGVPLPKFQP
jgi:hypothetical protein